MAARKTDAVHTEFCIKPRSAEKSDERYESKALSKRQSSCNMPATFFYDKIIIDKPHQRAHHQGGKWKPCLASTQKIKLHGKIARKEMRNDPDRKRCNENRKPDDHSSHPRRLLFFIIVDFL